PHSPVDAHDHLQQARYRYREHLLPLNHLGTKVVGGDSFPPPLERMPAPRRHPREDRLAKIDLGLLDLGRRCACPLPRFPWERKARDQVRNCLLRHPPRPFLRHRQQTRRDQVNETQQTRRDQVSKMQFEIRDFIRVPERFYCGTSPVDRPAPAGREERYWSLAIARDVWRNREAPTLRRALDHAARFDPASFPFADDPQLGSFRRAVEVTRNRGNGLTRRHPWYVRSSLVHRVAPRGRGQSPGAADPAPGGRLLLAHAQLHHLGWLTANNLLDTIGPAL